MSLIQIARPAQGLTNVCSLLILFILYSFSVLFICLIYLSNKYKQCLFLFFSEKSELLPWFYLLLCKYLSNGDIILFTFMQTSTKLKPSAKYFFLPPELYLILPSTIQLINLLYTSLLKPYYGKNPVLSSADRIVKKCRHAICLVGGTYCLVKTDINNLANKLKLRIFTTVFKGERGESLKSTN